MSSFGITAESQNHYIDHEINRIIVPEEEKLVGVLNVRERTYQLKVEATKYKTVEKKVKPIAAELPISLQLPTNNYEVNKDLQRLTPEKQQELNFGTNLTERETTFFLERLQQVDKVFAFNDQEMGLLRPSVEAPIRIPTVEHSLWNFKSYPLAKSLYPRIIALLKTKLESGVIEPSIGPYGNRWFVITKKDNMKLRFIQDMQLLNAHTIRNAGLPPDAEDIAEDVSGRKILTTFDLYSGYDQLPVDVRDRDKLAMNTPIGLIRMTRLPMGWTNSVGIFQRIMNKVLMKWIPAKVRIFMDDGCIKGRREANEELTEEGIRVYVRDHIEDVIAVLTTLIEAGLTISGKKTYFGVEEVEVLGFKCSSKGREPMNNKVEAILKWPVPKNIREVRSFVSTCSFYRIWIQSFSMIAGPLYDLTKKGRAFEWREEQQEAFDTMKIALTTPPIIRNPVYGNVKRPLIVTVDASPIGVGGVLGQLDENNKRYVIRYESHRFNVTEKRYPQIKRELFGAYLIVKRLRRYLYGTYFVLETDAQPMIGLLNKPDLPSDVASRWIAYMKLFDFEIKHIKGKENVVADGLSRIEYEESELPKVELIVGCSEPYTYTGLVSVEQTSIEEMDDDSPYKDLIYFLKHGEHTKGLKREQRSLVWNQSRHFFLQDGLLFKRSRTSMPQRVITSRTEQLRIIVTVHEGHPSGHRGIKATQRMVWERFYWKGLYTMVEKYVITCERCQKHDSRVTISPLKPNLGSVLFSRVGIDLIQWPESHEGFKYLAVARDDFSGWVEARSLKTKRTMEVYRFLYEDVISRFGVPGEILADRGELWHDITKYGLAEDGIRLSFTTRDHPQTNGLVERGHLTLMKALAKVMEPYDYQNWPKYLHSVLWADRISVRRTTGYPPYELMYGQSCALPMDIEHDTWLCFDWEKVKSREELLEYRARQLISGSWARERAGLKLDRVRLEGKKYYDDTHEIRHRPFKEGDLVLLKNSQFRRTVENKFMQRWVGPFRIASEQNPNVYTLAELDGVHYANPTSGDRLKHFFPRKEGLE